MRLRDFEKFKKKRENSYYFFYVFHFSKTNFYKIGFTNNITRRVNQINSVSPHDVKVIFVIGNKSKFLVRTFESMIKKRYKNHFKNDSEVLVKNTSRKLIEEIVNLAKDFFE